MKFPLLTVCLTVVVGCLSSPSVFGGLINVSYVAQPGQRNIVDHSGTALSDGNEVRVGYFSAEFDVAANSDDLAALKAAWISYQPDDPNRFIQTLSGQPGRFSSTHSAEAGTFTGKKVYLWVFKTVDAAPLNSDFTNVVEHGLFSSSLANWIFPSDELPITNSIAVTSSEVDQTFVGALSDNSLQLTEINPPSASYEQWASETFNESTPIGERDPDDDPDFDGLENAFEYLTGSDPENLTKSAISSQVLDGESFVLSYLRSKTVLEDIETILVSNDLVNWVEDPNAIQTSSEWSSTQLLVTVRFPLIGLDHVFARIVVSP